MTTAPARPDDRPTRRPAVEPELRGRLVIADRAVARIAARVAAEVDGIIDPRAGSGGRGWRGRAAARRPRAVARIDGQDVHVSLSVALTYPVAVAAVCDEIREHVRDRVRDLTGLRAGPVDIRVPVLRRAGGRGPGIVA